ncbi:MAG: tRNA 2-thiouridine(34) synthase MnmA [Steroidobacteraceae bacterium]
MSGGVDSAVAALLLQRAGCEVQGLHMSNWDEDGDAYCTAAADFQDARRICAVLGIPLHSVSFAAEYRERVFAHFVSEYAAGRTPNPDVLCNREIKFGVCLEYMHRLGGAWIATGHYARVYRTAGGVELHKAADAAKDQSYFLHQVPADALQKTLFPLGDLCKHEVRHLAHAAGLPVFDKPDSTGICFIGERPFEEFLSRYVLPMPGPIETPDGEILGQHRGLAFHTLGQRSGLGIGGRAGGTAAPWYVAFKEPHRNALIVVQDRYHPLLLSDVIDVVDIHWLPRPPGDARHGEFDCAVKTRYRQRDLPCRVHPAGTSATVTLQCAASSVTPGQYAVFYQGDRCLGGGVIAERHNSQLPARAVAYNLALSAEAS